MQGAQSSTQQTSLTLQIEFPSNASPKHGMQEVLFGHTKCQLKIKRKKLRSDSLPAAEPEGHSSGGAPPATAATAATAAMAREAAGSRCAQPAAQHSTAAPPGHLPALPQLCYHHGSHSVSTFWSVSLCQHLILDERSSSHRPCLGSY